jgi:radical SAM family uncharacterized protein
MAGTVVGDMSVTGTIWSAIEPLLPRVQKPARYLGLEGGMIEPQHDPSKVAWLVAYPDTYEVGLPNAGLQILYEILNERSDAVCERSYAPWVDMEREMRAAGVPLFSVDTHRPARAFDVIAFNLAAELVYTNVLSCVDLAGVPVRTADRTDDDPFVLIGGHCSFNPEPLADFVDAACLGDGEELVGDITVVLGEWKRAGRPGGRREAHRRLAGIDGVYVPSLYRVEPDGAVVPDDPAAPPTVHKRTITDLAAWPYPKHQLTPLTEVVHDRLNVEVFRGCTRGCRFCQAGMITRPVRERPASQVREMVEGGLARTGHDEVALTSLSTADYSGIEEVVGAITCSDTAVSLPSLRVDAFTVGLAAQVAKARRTGLTFAPEGGTWRMRKVINKLITEEDLYAAVDAAFAEGWRRLKLYFLIGLPTETDDDVLAIVELAARCARLGRERHRGASVTVSVGGFVPKPHTPFQWFGMDTSADLQRKVDLLRAAARRHKGVELKWHDPAASQIEGLVSRGDRSLCPVLETVWRAGGVFQEWTEHFKIQRWLDACAEHGVDAAELINGDRPREQPLPWGHLSAGLHEDFLWQDWQDALAEAAVEDCRWTPCYDCGACTGYGVEHVVASATPPAGGSQGTGQDLSVGGEVPVRLLPTRQPVGVGA